MQYHLRLRNLKKERIRHKIMKALNLISVLLLFPLITGFVLSGCGKKGPPRMMDKRADTIDAVRNFTWRLQDNNLILRWSVDKKQLIAGFEIHMARQNIKKCLGCPVVFIKTDTVSSDFNQYKTELERGYRYYFKIITLGINSIRSNDSEIIKVEFD